MARRSLRTSVGAGALALALIAAGCGNSKSSNNSNGSNGGGTGNGIANSLAKIDCGTLKYDANAPMGGTFTDYVSLSSSADNTTFDPAATQTLNEAQITTAVWDGLTDFDFTQKCDAKLKGRVAESWTANKDATVFTFKVRKGEVFSNGEPVLPSNFKKGWERAGSKDLASPYGYLINYVKGGKDLQAGKIKTLPSIVADDAAMTLTVTLETPNADFPAIATHQFWSPISNADLKKLGNTTGWGEKGAMIGNGPFMIQSAPGTDKDVVLVKNPKWAGNVYGDKTAHLDKIIFKATVDVGTAYQAFESGQGNSAPVPPGQFAAADKKYVNNTIHDPILGTYYFDIGADGQLGGAKNLELRRAVSQAIDRAEINQKVYENTRTISTGITPPGIPGFAKGLCKYCTTDVASAKAHFKKWQDAGGKLSGPIKLEYNPGGGHDKVAAIIQGNLKDVLGVSAKLDPISQKYFSNVAKKGACEVCRSGWYADYPTYGNFMIDLFGAASIDGNNFGRFNNPEFEKVVASAQAATDPVKRGKLYQQAEDIVLNQQTVAIPLNWYVGSDVFRDNVVNFDDPPLGLRLWERIAVKS